MVNTTINKVTFNCNGVQTVFPFAFKIFSKSTDIRVILTSSLGVETELTYITHFTVTATNDNFDNGGNVTTVATYDTGNKITIVRELGITQGSDYVENGPFPAAAFEADLDKRVMVEQQLDEKITRGLRVPITDEAGEQEIPNDIERAGKFLAFDASGVPIAADAVTGAPVTPFMETVLDDSTLLEARDTLHIAYDVVVRTQAQFNAIIERVSANRYKISNAVRSLYLRYKTGGGGYYCYGVTSFLSGGDTWGYIETNNCARIVMEPATYLFFGNARGYLKVTTIGAVVEGVEVRGNTITAAAGADYSFLVAAQNVTLRNCISNEIYTDSDFSAFAGGNYKSARFEGCKVYTINCNTAGRTIRAFYQCYNISGAYVEDITIANGSALLFDNCYFINNSYIYNVSSIQDLYGFSQCENISNCYIDTFSVTGSSSVSCGFANCNEISSSTVKGVTNSSTSGSNYAFVSCNRVSACKAINIQSTGSSGTAQGFNSCYHISACYAENVNASSTATAYGFNACRNISGCDVTSLTTASGNAFGYLSCVRISACYCGAITSSGTKNGFNTCSYGSSLNTAEAANAGNDFMDTTDANITNKFSTMATSWT